jgi:NTP pyrophosphatase (non-canonical NTP hydrolase)
MDIFTKIEKWNEERGLLGKGFDHTRETSFIIEELLESTGAYDSLTARDKALEYAKEIIGDKESSPEEVVDAFADIIVFATGAIAKNGYSPAKVMAEVFKEIDSRKGSLIEGKFVKDTSVVPYKADFNSCKK